MIVLHSTNCPKCNILKKKLENKHITFEENLDVNKIIELGYKSAPVLQVNDNFMDFVTASKWINQQ